MTARVIMKLHVAERRDAGDDVACLTLKHDRRKVLPAWSAGAHVDLRLPDGKMRQYSLVGDPLEADRYVIAVKREESGRGGSLWIHDTLAPGAEVHVSAPRNNFPLSDSPGRHVMIAGGIGITPFVAMARELARRGADFTLHYCARSQHPPLLDDLRAICGNRLVVHGPAGAGRFDAGAMLAAEGDDATAIYCCAPDRLARSVREASWRFPADAFHAEAFKPILDENFKPAPFDLTIASTGQVLRVPADRSALGILRDNGFQLPSSCELGVCGSCECGYRDGVVIHRDSVLGIAARKDRLMLCVSRAHGGVTLAL